MAAIANLTLDQGATFNSDVTVKDANGNPTLIIADVNSTNATLHTGVTTPDDYFGYKYSYANSEWTAIEGWIDPRLEANED